ncbi:hypothetical protein BDB00DRAFT_940014 [Zychaea mexicana]|uniref:uncharacterized protein n=1 Tax=Zychaea mexicana TaxID=64656 RepID=UPI0022FE0A21|nr:uncharacterized protein BDB00DRAFT_940014 [Zychaea mexicana]KAI9491871.1 hypothetical protein BDB00DRAFT_940014 [Zychaea mexicana]
MQNRITKSCQARRNRRADRLRELLQLTQADSVLLDACKRKKAVDVEALLSAFSCINPDNVRDNHLRTPLHIACGRRDDLQEATAIARVLIRAGSDVNNGVGDVDGLQPMHMAVLAGNISCVLMLLEEGASVPASDPFRLTPLLLAKLKMDNLRQTQLALYNDSKNSDEEDDDDDYTEGDNNSRIKNTTMSSNAQQEYQDLQSITKVLVTHLANKHITTYGLPSQDPNPHYHGISDRLFARERKDSDQQLNQAIVSITDQLSGICMQDNRDSDPLIQDAVNMLMEKVRSLGLEETAVK